MRRGVLLLADGTYYTGKLCGAVGEVTGEVVFNTGMSGYQEILTDPSYTGQIVLLTYPLIGNYGINYDDNQADKITTSALIVKELHRDYGNRRSEEELEEFLIRNNIVCLQGIDTRSVVLNIRKYGSMNGIIASADNDIDSLLKRLKSTPDIVGLDLVKKVTTPHIYRYDIEIENSYVDFPVIGEESKVNCITVYDFGIKSNMLRYLRSISQKLIVLPAKTPVEELLSYKPTGIFLSNGPGDPAAVDYAIDNVRSLLDNNPNLPVFGVCLGHQIIALALGGKSYKLKFGHHGVNQPVKNLISGKVEITSQNHCFAIDEESLRERVKITHINLNDDTVEGIQLYDRPVFSVQYHPEAGPGPNDSNYLFEKFYKSMI